MQLTLEMQHSRFRATYWGSVNSEYDAETGWRLARLPVSLYTITNSKTPRLALIDERCDQVLTTVPFTGVYCSEYFPPHKRWGRLNTANLYDPAEELYEWENQLRDWGKVTRKAAKRKLLSILEEFRLETGLGIDVTFGKDVGPGAKATTTIRREGLFGKPLDITVHFKKRVHRYVVLHEAAHVIDYLATRSMHHGPSFLHIYYRLLAKHGRMPLAGIHYNDKNNHKHL